jgi:iron(III) transport system substrate-binding protein
MRLAKLSALIVAIMLLAAPATAFEIEGEELFTSGSGTTTIRVVSTADLEIFGPLIEAFQVKNPDIDVHYTLVGSSDLMRALYDEGAQFDVAISSAMDLQTKLANDGLARTYRSAQTNALPDWARWRDQVFSFTQEPAVLIVSLKSLEGLPMPANRQDLIALLRDNPDRFDGRIGTYDVRQSGLGYLFATQDSRNSDSFWRLTEVMGRLDARLYCCSGEMIADVAGGKLALAYNVLGSYATAHLEDDSGLDVVYLEDYSTVMLRTALIPATVEHFPEAGVFIDFLTAIDTRPLIAQLTGLPPLDPEAIADHSAFRPIRLGPGLLVYLDQIKRKTFLKEWISAIDQP